MTVEFQFGPEVIRSYKRLAYTPWHALAEFVDNSTQSYFNHRTELDEEYDKDADQLTVSIDYNQAKGYIRVRDNAMGMSFAELKHALHVGRPPADTSGRSKYGMGMKTAACWLGNRWHVRTKKLGETVEYGVTVDVDNVADGKSILPEDEKAGIPADKHYTIIEIEELNRLFSARTIGKIKSFLRSMYREDFRNGTLVLYWGNEQLLWVDDPNRFLKDRAGKPYKKDFKFKVSKKTVRGWVGILARGSREDAGFSILHCGRVVRGYPDSWRPESLYGQIQGSNDLVNQRLVGEVHLDEFDVSHTKDDILWIGDEEEKVEEGLKKHGTDYREIAASYRKARDDTRGPSAIETRAAIDELTKELTSPEMNDAIKVAVIPPKAAVEESVKSIAASIVKTQESVFTGKIGGISVRLFVVSDMSPNDPYLTLDARNEKEVIVIVNQAHPHWRQLRGSEGVVNYLRHCTYDGIAEWQCWSKASRIDPDTIKLLKDKLLRIPLEIEKHETE
jgi:hypothetical protein